MKKFILALILCSGFVVEDIQAQYYRNSSGVRLGYTSAITYKRFINNSQAIELMASGRDDGFQLTTFYQINKPMNLGFSENFYAYYGVGGHFGYVRRVESTLLEPAVPPTAPVFGVTKRSFFAMGVNTILGVEYRWLAAPLTFSFDIKPYAEFVGMREFEFRFWDVSFSVKYVF